MPLDQNKALTPGTSVSGSRILLLIFALTQLLLGLFSFSGVNFYLADDWGNPSRYQFLFVPAGSFILAVPFLILSAVLYRRCRPEMLSFEQWLLTIACSLPLFAFGAAILVGVVGL